MTKPTDRELRSFGVVTGIIVAVLFGLLVPWLRGIRFPAWPFAMGAVLMLFGLSIPRVLAPLHRLWIRIGVLLAWFNTRVVLGAVFLLIVTPVAVMLRFFGRDPLARKFEPGLETYRVPSVPRPPDTMKDPF